MKPINLFVPQFRKKEIMKHLEECFDKGWTGLGFKTLEFEEEWKKYTQLPNAHFLSSNTVGLHLAVKILKDSNKWESDSEIITTPLTFVSTNHAILYEGLTPIFADIDDSLCLSPESIEQAITKKTKAVLFVGIGGNTGRLDDVVRICKKHNLKLILDAAHMAGTFVKNSKGNLCHVGTEADVVVFSFQAVKNLPTADSGMICFKNTDYDTLARKLAWLGINKDTYQRTNEKGAYKWEYDLVDVGFKYHGNSMMASMGLVGLKYLEEDNNYRRKICKYYEDSFEGVVDYVSVSKYCEVSSRHLFQIVVKNRNKFMERLNLVNIFPGVHYMDNTKYSMYKSSFGSCPNSHTLSENIISLPLHTKLSDSDVDYVVKQVITINGELNG